MSTTKLPLLSLPCKVQLNELSPTEKGLHCSNCDKVLTDFRGKANDEVVQTIRTAPHKVCGIFTPNQFDFKTSKLSFSATQRRVGLSLLGILGFLGPVTTGCSGSDHQNDAQDTKQKAFNNLKFPMKVEGMLKDEKTGQPLALATVSIFQNGKVIRKGKTDEHGSFSILLQKGDLIRENFDFIVKQRSQSDTLKAFDLVKTAGKQKIRLTVKADTRGCEQTLGFVAPAVSDPVYAVEGEVMWEPPVDAEETPVAGGLSLPE